MIYLGLSIVAAVILVGIAIRRLPYLRTNRLGLEITSPKPYLSKPAPVAELWQRVTSLLQGIMRKRTFPIDETGPSFHKRYNSSASGTIELDSATASPMIQELSPAQPMEIKGFSSNATDPFWREEPGQSAGPLELPTKGLISRRGESQKIAQELITQADEAFRKKDFHKAEKYYLQAATKDPDNARIYNRLGVIYLQMKNYKDAVEAFRGAIRFDDRVASRHYNLALAYLGKRDYRSANRSLQEAIRQDPTNEKYRKTLEAIQRQPV